MRSERDVLKTGSDGNSRGFGFIRFNNFEDQKKVVGQTYSIQGRTVEVKKPHSQQSTETCRVFVGRLNASVSKDDLMDYFNQYGAVVDCYYEPGKKQFGFVTFEDPEVASCVIKQRDHQIKDAQAIVNTATPQQRTKTGGPPGPEDMYQQPMSPKGGFGHPPPHSQPGYGFQPQPESGGYPGGPGGPVYGMGQPPPHGLPQPVPAPGAPMGGNPPPQMDPTLFGQQMLDAMTKMAAVMSSHNMANGQQQPPQQQTRQVFQQRGAPVGVPPQGVPPPSRSTGGQTSSQQTFSSPRSPSGVSTNPLHMNSPYDAYGGHTY